MPPRMTSRERVLAAIRREPVDYVPCCAHFNPLDPVLRRGHSWNFPWSAQAGPQERITYQVEELGLDALVPFGAGATRTPEDVAVRTWLEGDELHKQYSTPAGDLHACVRYNDLWPHGQDIPFYSDFNIGHFVEPWIQNARDVECLRCVQMPLEVDEIVAAVQARARRCRDLADRFGLAVKAGAGTGLTGAQHLCGAEGVCFMAIEQPDALKTYLAHEHDLNLRLIRAYAELGVDIVGRNGFYETADFYGPAMLNDFLTASLSAEAEATRAGGMVSSYTVHTGIMPILDYLADLPLDSLQGVDIAFKDVDIERVRDRLADSKAFWTGPSSTYHIWAGPEPTREAVRRVFDCFGKTGLILTQCVSSHSMMPWESTAAMIDEWRKLR